jgi:hypothetical protein
VTARETAEVIGNTVEIILVRWRLIARVVHRQLLRARNTTIDARRKRSRHVRREIKVLEWEVDEALDLVSTSAFRGEALEVNKENRR